MWYAKIWCHKTINQGPHRLSDLGPKEGKIIDKFGDTDISNSGLGLSTSKWNGYFPQNIKTSQMRERVLTSLRYILEQDNVLKFFTHFS